MTMMQILSNVLANGRLNRALVGGITAALIALNRKLGLGLELEDIAALVSLAVAYIGQSAMKEVKMAGVQLAGVQPTPINTDSLPR